VYESTGGIRVSTAPGNHDGGLVVPGFQLPLDGLFDPVVPSKTGI
jgi:hypothetical protein